MTWFTAILKYIVPPFTLCFSTLSFNTLSLRHQVGMSLKAFHNENNTKRCAAEILELFHIITEQK